MCTLGCTFAKAHRLAQNHIKARRQSGLVFFKKSSRIISVKLLRQIIFLGLLAPVFVWADAYSKNVLADKPVLYWRFSETSGSSVKPTIGKLVGEIVGGAKLNASGPRAGIFPDFEKSNSGLSLSGGGSFIRIKDPGEKSVLDFHNGDSITLEAWINPSGLPSGY